ncbi:hypothetical protein BVRB_8g187940 [Beta vulgaris subsp. vulgaris]|nr:hypothetical protein BVRB_8g187940 [Beta vulgaris subsp. vulgaris]
MIMDNKTGSAMKNLLGTITSHLCDPSSMMVSNLEKFDFLRGVMIIEGATSTKFSFIILNFEGLERYGCIMHAYLLKGNPDV